MPELEPRDSEWYPYKLTDEQLEEAKNLDLPGIWRYSRTVESGFVMYEYHIKRKIYREASVGPTQDGEVRSYVATEQEDGRYDTDLRYEGNFDEAVSRLQDYLENE